MKAEDRLNRRAFARERFDVSVLEDSAETSRAAALEKGWRDAI